MGFCGNGMGFVWVSVSQKTDRLRSSHQEHFVDLNKMVPLPRSRGGIHLSDRFAGVSKTICHSVPPARFRRHTLVQAFGQPTLVIAVPSRKQRKPRRSGLPLTNT